MRYGFRYHAQYWATVAPDISVEHVRTAERLGFDSVWTSEAYGSDVLTPLAWWGSGARTIGLGTNVLQMSARTPAATAMAAMTLDHLSGGRFVLGIGASGPQVVEGWYGQPFAKPLARTREYVQIVRAVIARQSPVQNSGESYPLPLPGGTGLGRPLRSSFRPLRTSIPVLLAAQGPNNISLAAEIGDGWLPMFFSPRLDDYYRGLLAEGFARPGAQHTSLADFEVAAYVPVVVADDVDAAADELRELLALYIGGMGPRTMNFHANAFRRMGYEAEVERIQDLYLDGHRADAAASIPRALIEEVALVGPVAKIRDDAQRWQDTVLTRILVQTDPRSLEDVATALLT